MLSFWLQKPTKIASWRRLGTSGARLGGLFERLGRVLERLGLMWEHPGGDLERPGRILERLRASRARLQTSGARSDRNYVRGGARIAALLGPGEAQLSRRGKRSEGNLTQKNYLQSECMRVSAESECRE